MELVVLVMVCLSPWAFGGVEPLFEFLLYASVALLLGLWAARMLLDGQLLWKKCPVALCLAGLFLIGIWQFTPLPGSMLRWLASGTARAYAQFLPAKPEVLPLGEPSAGTTPPAGSTISVHPAATKQEATRLLAVFLLFVAVRNNIASPGSFWRLAVVALVNGTLLAFFGLVQFFTSPHNTLYWSFVSRGQVFGPFICRNHFPFYLNVCVGLGLGLIPLALKTETNPAGRSSGRTGPGGGTRRKRPEPPSHEHYTRSDFSQPSRHGHRHRQRFWDLLGLLQEPRALWICAAVAFMIGSIAFSLSRGGMLALLGAAIVAVAIKLCRVGRYSRPGTILLVSLMTLGLLTWIGFDQVEARVATLWQGEVLQQGRLPLWTRTLPLAADFPIWGSGYGTFQYVEPLKRTDPADVALIYDHAHNDYLEALVEGGVPRLFLSLLAIGLVFRLGYRALCRYEGSPLGGLLLGALFGFTTVVLHSVGDFGLHIPAVAILAAVLAAHLCALAPAQPAGAAHAGRAISPSSKLDESKVQPAEQASYTAASTPTSGSASWAPAPDAQARSAQYTFRLGGLAPLAGAVMALALGLVLYGEGRRTELAQRLRLAAFALGKDPNHIDRDRQLDYLDAAARLAPEYARLRFEMGEYHLAVFKERTRNLQRSAGVEAAVTALAAAARPVWPAWAEPGAFISTSGWLALAAARQLTISQEEEDLTRRHLLPGMRHYLQARDLCPLMGPAQLQIAANVAWLEQAEPRSAYLERAKLLDPADAELWYLCGVQELVDEQPARTWQSWHRSLELSDRYLPEILTASARLLGPSELLERILPEKPGMVLTAALQLYPGPESAPQRVPFLERALSQFETQPGPWRAEDLRDQAWIYWTLDQPIKALRTYEGALGRNPAQMDWRLEYARLLAQQGFLREARRELLMVLQHREDAEARKLFDTVGRAIAEKM
jgi:hypothetical protein